MLEARPPAKINLTLEVVGRRPDGYHELDSIVHAIGLSDELSMALRTAGSGDQLTVTGLTGAPPTRDNLVLRALDAVRSHVGINFPALEVTLDKRIPSGAGMGGGSSDCASALLLGQMCWGVSLSPDEEVRLARMLGSDVPFFLGYQIMQLDSGLNVWGGAPHVEVARVRGTGEVVEPLDWIHPDLAFLVVTPPTRLDTRSVFDRYDQLEQNGLKGPSAGITEQIYGDVFLDQPSVDDMLTWMPRLRDANDLWPAAASLEPSLPALRDELETATGLPWMMSGSGTTLFSLYASADEASEAGKGLVERRASILDDALIYAVDRVGPDPAWRYP